MRDSAGCGRDVRSSELPVQVVRRFTGFRCRRSAHKIVEAVSIALEYGQTEWRLALAELPIERGCTPEGVRELSAVLHLRPQSDKAHSLPEGIAAQENAGLNAL